MQAIPRSETEAKKAVKNIFYAPPGKVMVQLDYKANEMRWVTILAKDKVMAEAFIKGKQALDDYRLAPTEEKLKLATLFGDIHSQNASKAFKVPIHDVNKDLRQKAKGISFGVLYDSSEQAISEQYGIPYLDVVEMFKNFYAEHTGIYNWKLKMKDMAKRYGYVETPHGRRRRFPIFDLYRNEHGYFQEDLVPKDQISKIKEALRQSSNAPVQGIASDASYIGSYFLEENIRKNKRDWEIVNAVHDSCVFLVPFEELDESLSIAEKCFEEDLMDYMNAVFDIDFITPLETEFEIGTKWGELTKWNFSRPELDIIKQNILS
jgi:DNA polymerase-1